VFNQLSLRVPYRPLADRPWMKKLGFPPFFGPGGGNSFLLVPYRPLADPLD
jgi:hypothetical protein